MSFRVWKGESPQPAPSATAAAARASLPPDVLEAGAGRLAVLALLTAAINVVFGILDWRIFGRPGAAMPTASVWLGATFAGLGLPLTVAGIAWRRMLAPSTLLDLGLVFEVAQALCISLAFHAVPIHTDMPPRGWTGVAVWILAYPLIVPATRGRTILATTAAAAMDRSAS
jgi:serine/threonine-protein kinase